MRESKEVASGEGSRSHESLVERVVDAAREVWEEQRPRAESEARGERLPGQLRARRERGPVASRGRRERLRAGLAALVEAAEVDPEATSTALWNLRGDLAALERLEACLGAADPDEATLRLGAALQVAGAELSSPAPDLRARLPELLRWLDP